MPLYNSNLGEIQVVTKELTCGSLHAPCGFIDMKGNLKRAEDCVGEADGEEASPALDSFTLWEPGSFSVGLGGGVGLRRSCLISALGVSRSASRCRNAYTHELGISYIQFNNMQTCRRQPGQQTRCGQHSLPRYCSW